MNWAKLDSGLIAALGTGGPGGGFVADDEAGPRARVGVGREAGVDERTLSVFVHVDPSGTDVGVCRRLGMGPPGEEVLTATLSPDQVAELSDLPWVSRLALSGPLRLLGGDQAPPWHPR